MEESVTEVLWKMYAFTAVRYLLIAGAAFGLAYFVFKGALANARIQERLAKRKDFLLELRQSLLSSTMFAVVGYITFKTPLVNYTQYYTDIDQYPGWYVWASAGLGLIIHDTYFYWLHRLMHHRRLFRITHKAHHLSTNPSPWAAYSFNLIEAFVEGLVLTLIVMLIPMHGSAIVIFLVVGLIINVYGHLGFEIAPRAFRYTIFFELLNTSVHHNLHHSKFKGNYGLYFRLWDRICGTEHPDYVKEFDRVQGKRFGAERPAPFTLYGFLKPRLRRAFLRQA